MSWPSILRSGVSSPGAGGDLAGPTHDAGRAKAAFVGRPAPAPQRRVLPVRLGPSPLKSAVVGGPHDQRSLVQPLLFQAAKDLARRPVQFFHARAVDAALR